MEDATITMPLKDYNKLIAENKVLEETVKNKDSICLNYKYESYGMGHYKQTWNIVTKDEMIQKMVTRIEELCVERTDLDRELKAVREKRK